MKKLFFAFVAILFLSTAFADDKDKCNQGNQDPAQRDPHEEPSDSTDFAGQTSVDPNEIIGPQGYDSLQWVSINDVLNYTIYFENDPEFATANAQRVDVRFEFDKKELMKDFILGGYGFANMSWEMEKPSNTYQNRINLVDTMSIYVDLIAGLDVTKKQAFWKFSSIDPESGFAPWQHDRGMLPVNDSTHVGEGFVRFSIKPVSTMHTGDTISIQANIVFDQNDTIPTNRWKNVIDAGTPTSRVSVLDGSPVETSSVYRLKFEAADDENGSGVKQVYLYLANQFGTYEEYAVCAPDSIITIETEPGRRYEFYSLAEDNVGNREPLKEQADVVLNNNVAPTDIALSSTTFQDDIQPAGFIAEISSVDTEEGGTFTYALAEGDGAIHNDLFQVEGSRLQAKQLFKCATDSVYKIRLSTTDQGGLTFSKAFELSLQSVLVHPQPDTVNVEICDGESFRFHGVEYTSTGLYHYSESNDYMCDSLFVLNVTLRPALEGPNISAEDICTLVSSSELNNQWFREDGTPIEGATDQRFTPTEDGIYYVATRNGACYSEPSQAYRVQFTDQSNLQLDLKTGWNWISSNLSGADDQNAMTFLSPIQNVTDRFVGQTQELINDPVYGLTGGLTTINPTEGYRIHVSQDVTGTWNGIGSQPEATTINLQKGWNWIGYVPVVNHPLAEALVGLTPTENEIIRCMDDFAIYIGNHWMGTIDVMKPGESYMYYAFSPRSFNYPIQRAFPVTNDSRMMAPKANAGPWNYDSHQYPDNTTLIGRLFVNGNAMLEGVYSVGAFCGGECRGIGKYVEGLVFLTIHGDLSSSQQITFKAYENVTGTELPIVERITFDGQQVGNVTTPFALHTSTTTGIEDMAAGFTIYPRPLRSRMFVGGNTDNIKSIRILSTNGQTVLDAGEYESDGIDVGLLIPGVYVVAIITKDNKVCYEKVLKANN